MCITEAPLNASICCTSFVVVKLSTNPLVGTKGKGRGAERGNRLHLANLDQLNILRCLLSQVDALSILDLLTYAHFASSTLAIGAHPVCLLLFTFGPVCVIGPRKDSIRQEESILLFQHTGLVQLVR